MPLLFDIGIAIRAAAQIRRQRRRAPVSGIDIYLCMVDHFEPQVGRPEPAIANARVADWLDRYPIIARRHRDFDGRHPARTYFYPVDEFDTKEMTAITKLCGGGFGEVELHLHHQDDTAETLRKKVHDALDLYRSFGWLPSWPDGRIAFGFIHGNWALDNSRQEHGRNYCGVDSEITVLAEEGCYADFTFPAWQHLSQPRMTNRIYYATDDPNRPKSHDTGIPAAVGRQQPAGSLMIVHGPLVPFRAGWRPAIDDGDLASYRRYSPERLDRWISAGISVSGRPDRVFVKLHTHGAADKNRACLLGKDLEALFSDAEARYNDGSRWRLHYVTAREMYNVIKATENGGCEAGSERDFVLPPPAAA